MDPNFSRQYDDFKRYNGMMPGAWTGQDHIKALIADREMVLNPDQQAAIIRNAGGIDVFAGAGIPNYSAGTVMPKFADGVNLNNSPLSSLSSSNDRTDEPMICNFEFEIDAEGIVNVGLQSNRNQKIVFGTIKNKIRNKG